MWSLFADLSRSQDSISISSCTPPPPPRFTLQQQEEDAEKKSKISSDTILSNSSPLRVCLTHAHRMVRGVSVAPDGESCVSCSADCTVKLWKVPFAPFEAGQVVDISEWALEFTGMYMYI